MLVHHIDGVGGHINTLGGDMNEPGRHISMSGGNSHMFAGHNTMLGAIQLNRFKTHHLFSPYIIFLLPY